MIETLVTLLILGIIIYAVVLVIGLIPLPAPIKNIAYLIVGIIFLLVLLNYLGLYSGNFGGGHGILVAHT